MTVAAVMVSYPAHAGARFDRGYYVATHLPLVERVFAPHGLTGVHAFFPDDEGGATLATAVLHFRDATARDAALGHADAGEAFGDIPNFTDAQPLATRVTAAS